MEFAELLRNPSLWSLVVLFLYVLYQERDRLVGIFVRRAQVSTQRDEADLRFDELARQKVLRNGDYSHELVQFFLKVWETERIERRAVNSLVIEQAGTARHQADEAVDVMRNFVDIARRMVDRQDARDEELIKLVREQYVAIKSVEIALRQVAALADAREEEAHG